MLRSKKSDHVSRSPRLEYKKQQSYHYSSKRINDEQTVGRGKLNQTRSSAKTPGKNSFIKNTPTLFSILLVIVSVIYLFTLSNNPIVVVTNPSAKTQLIDKKVVSKKINDELSKRLLNRFKPTFDSQKATEAVLKLSPEITDAKFSINALRHNPKLVVEFSAPSVLLSSNNRIYLVGDNGKVLTDITTNKNGFKTDRLSLVEDASGVDIKVGKQGLTTQQVDYINQIKFQSEQKALTINSMTIQPGGSQMDVRYKDIKYFIKFNFFEDARKSSGVFLATKEKLDLDHIVPAEYIDVRVPDRAYVK